MYIIENEIVALIQYTHEDDNDMYKCWQDIQTQKGYNYIFDISYEEFQSVDINQFKFWVIVVNKTTNEKIGSIRLGLDEKCPDLAIWIYPNYRNKGFGAKSFRLALEYLFNQLGYKEISAGCYCDNEYSLRMLKKIGFVRYPKEDIEEINVFTDKPTYQYVLKIDKKLMK